MSDNVRIDHVTIHVPLGTFLHGNRMSLLNFMNMLGFKEVQPSERPESLRVRWFKIPYTKSAPLIHFVEGAPPIDMIMMGMNDQIVLGHFCIAAPEERVRAIRLYSEQHGWLDRDNPESERFWVRFKNIRVEVRTLV